jgi:hypothetical protein
MATEDPSFKAIAAHVAVCVDDVQAETTYTGLPRWRFGDRVAWFENDNGKPRLMSRTGSGVVVEIQDDPGGNNPADLLAHHPADIAELIADALVDPVEPSEEGPLGLS